MESIAMAPWLLLLALGAFHGVNPGMGWLFAVARGMQEGRRTEVWRALLPLGAGHALAVGAAVAAALALGSRLPGEPLRWGVAAILIALGARRLVRHRHPRLGGMRVGMAGLTAWSFLMATAHGAGLMVVPVLLGGDASQAHAAHGHAAHAAGLTGFEAALAATAIHAAGYLLVAALVAVLVYEKVGLRFLRTGWFNLDLLWALALIATGGLTLLA
ncbi:MAG TPA: hypothetical protein VLD61_01050 [Methylomirabilota bacterium]|nr:hypothetical protein [Methylomirabilota bacterium]